ncbi:MAG TPA: hypothetical protein PKK10_12510 [Woeseiaceae bacterium]|nr:hypothetical protein [Woeseiaceae bacterium]
MDKLKDALRHDAARIEVQVSAELDNRIRASLENTRPASQPRREQRKRRFPFWLASGLTGVAASALVILLVRINQPEQTVVAANPEQQPAGEPLEIPQLRMESAVFTAPLERELDDLESDLKKAKQAVSEELRLSF